MSILAWIEDQRKLKLLNTPKYNHPASDGSQGLWTRCDHCGVILYIKHLKENQRVCFGCGYHLQMNSQERIEHLIDSTSWRPLDEILSPCDPLEFRDQKQYTERLKEAQERTGLQDAVQTGTGMLDGIPIALGVMDFNFMGGSMGSVVGEKITRLIEYATQEGLTLILVCASGGARMQEGILSLMQMAKISAALQIYQSCANLFYISVLTSPTTGGVTASFAMLGDLIFAEPKALIGFAGRRVIEQTLQEQLPDDFQTAEYLLHHGLLDLIVPRSFLKQALSETITLYKDAPFKQSGIIPYGTQHNLDFLTEEKIRRKCKNWEKNLLVESSWILHNGSDFAQPSPMVTQALTDEEQSSGSLEEFIKNYSKDKDSTKILPAFLSELVFTLRNERLESSLPSKVVPRGEQREMVSQEENSTKLVRSSSENILKNLYFSYQKAPLDSWYREILLSFQTMFTFFDSPILVLPSKIIEQQKNVSKSEHSRETLKSLKYEDALLDKVLFQNSNTEQVSENSPNSKNKQRTKEFIQKSISLASNQTIEWRTLYLNQNIQAKNSFLQDLATSNLYQKKTFKKKFFYKSKDLKD